MIDIRLQGEHIKLLAERALWWPEQSTLIISDLHWGKSAHFRKNGIAIPLDTQPKDELRLAGLLRDYKAERLIVAGDLFHSKENKQVDVFSHFRKSHETLDIVLVTGNHDILAAHKYEDWKLETYKDCYTAGPFCISHDAIPGSNNFIIHGHIHPAIRIHGKAQQSLRLSCFVEDSKRFILPAFGSFTGNLTIDPEVHRHIYVIAGEQIIQWK